MVYVLLADAGRCAQENLQPATPFLLRRREECFGRWPMVLIVRTVWHANIYFPKGLKGAPVLETFRAVLHC
jgi:hypothetical protein